MILSERKFYIIKENLIPLTHLNLPIFSVSKLWPAISAPDLGVICINECLEGNERLFVMAHELGHAILHPKENCYFLRNQTFLNTKIEQEANAFAAEFLIPDEAILEAMENGYTIDQFARILGYEKELVELRMKRIS